MKTIVLLLLSLSLYIANGQSFNNEVSLEKGSPQLLGKINKSALLKTPYSDWFGKNYTEYQPSEAQTTQLSDQLSEYTISIFLGTWCGDSKREVPRFYKILDVAGFPLDRVTTVGVNNARDTYKQSPGGEEEGLNIHRVPTFIFYKNGKEMNRIVEFPVETLEQDMLKILQNRDYTPSYNSVKIINDALVKMGPDKFQKKAHKLLPKLKKEVHKVSELNTYANVLFFSDKREEAVTVAKLNTILFPHESSTYESLANKLYKTNKKELAFTYYNKAIRLDPKNERVKVALEKFE